MSLCMHVDTANRQKRSRECSTEGPKRLIRLCWDGGEALAGAPVHNLDSIAMLKINRLFQPRNPLFWIMVVLNGLSALLGWLTHAFVLGSVVSMLVVFFAIGNALLGTYLAWRLVNS